MRRSLALLFLLGCGRDSATAQARRGQELFEPAARALAEGLLAEAKARDPKEVEALLRAAGAKDEPAFVDLSVREILVRYGVVLALTESQAARFREGRFDDAGNRTRVEETLKAFGKDRLPLPEAGRYAADRVRAGDWSGLRLEFAARLVWAEAMRPR